jgi:hypothetical protein
MTKEQVYMSISNKIGITIDDNTIFFEGTGIDGLDAFTFMEEIADEFEIDLTEFNFKEYFNDDRSIIERMGEERMKRKIFTALHLFNVIQKKKWFNPETIIQ